MTGKFERGVAAGMFYAQGIRPVFLGGAHAMMVGSEPSIQAALAHLARPAASGGWVTRRARELSKDRETWIVSEPPQGTNQGAVALQAIHQFALGFKLTGDVGVDGEAVADSEASAEKVAAWVGQMKSVIREKTGVGALDSLTVEREGSTLRFAAKGDGLLSGEPGKTAVNSDFGVELYALVMSGFPGIPPRTVAAYKLLTITAGMRHELGYLHKVRWKRNFSDWIAIVVAILLIACAVAAYVTRDAGSKPTPAKRESATSPVDQRLLQTAQQMDAVADTSEEQNLSHEALRLADHELDQAFASALREANQTPRPVSGPLKEITDRVARFTAQIAAGQEQIAKLSKPDELELAKAQLALDQDELEDAQQDLARQGGDIHRTLERAMQQYQAAQQHFAQTRKTAAGPRTGILSEQVNVWFSLRERRRQLEDARRYAADHASGLQGEHDKLETLAASKSGTDLGSLRRRADQKKSLSELDKRIQDSRQLADVYARWLTVVEGRRRAILNAMLRGLSTIFAILFAVILIDRGVRRAFARVTDARRLHQLRVMATIAVQLIAAGVILLIVFGPPTQISTMLGLATAGLTIVMKDFIVAFFGWFALIGKNGVRVGDWVEIGGVSGEVIEIGLMKTVLLEMGNWTNAGHPTGRRVAIMNSFAIEGHYFNFSTAGQWLWDEVQATLPADVEPYKAAQQIREIVERETQQDAIEAEKDWERVTHQYGTRTFSAKPAVEFRTSVKGLDVAVRYITRAPERFQMRARLLGAIVELLRGGKVQG